MPSRTPSCRFTDASLHLARARCPCFVQVCAAEKISYDEQGLEALVFTAEGDLRHALNNLQSTFAGACKRKLTAR